MAATVFTNEVILLAINKIKESAAAAAAATISNPAGASAATSGGTNGTPAANGAAPPAAPPAATATDVNVTKKDVMDALFILTYLKHKHKKAEDAKAATPSTSQITETGSHNAVYSDTEINAVSLKDKIDSVLKNIDNKKMIDGSNAVDPPTSLQNHLYAKQNLARIVYFLALEACDALTRTNKFTSISADKTRYRIYQGGNTTSTYSSAIVADYTTGSYSTKIAFYKMLFLIASTLADNEINLDIKDQKSAGRKPVMYFFNDTSQGIVEINSNLIEDTAIRDKFKSIVINTGTPSIAETDHTSIKFKTPAPLIHGVTDVTVNLRVIQTILIGNNVHEYKAGALDIKSGWLSFGSTDTIDVVAARIANELLTTYTIDVGIASA